MTKTFPKRWGLWPFVTLLGKQAALSSFVLITGFNNFILYTVTTLSCQRTVSTASFLAIKREIWDERGAERSEMPLVAVRRPSLQWHGTGRLSKSCRKVSVLFFTKQINPLNSAYSNVVKSQQLFPPQHELHGSNFLHNLSILMLCWHCWQKVLLETNYELLRQKYTGQGASVILLLPCLWDAALALVTSFWFLFLPFTGLFFKALGNRGWMGQAGDTPNLVEDVQCHIYMNLSLTWILAARVVDFQAPLNCHPIQAQGTWSFRLLTLLHW